MEERVNIGYEPLVLVKKEKKCKYYLFYGWMSFTYININNKFPTFSLILWWSLLSPKLWKVCCHPPRFFLIKMRWDASIKYSFCLFRVSCITQNMFQSIYNLLMTILKIQKLFLIIFPRRARENINNFVLNPSLL